MQQNSKTVMRTHGTEGIFVLILGLLLSFFPGCASEPLEEGATSGEVALHSEPLVADAVGGRPASVPGDFITTPFGWAHPSCVIHVAEDEEQRDNVIVDSKGARRRDILPCKHRMFKRDGRLRLESGGRRVSETAPATNGWIAFADSPLLEAYKFQAAVFNVPAAPTGQDSQVLFFFPGLEPSDGSFILQPVLEWNQAGSRRWTITSWACCNVGGNVSAGNRVNVNPGEVIGGRVSGSNCNSTTGVCSTWTTTTDGSGNSTDSVLVTSNITKQMSWFIGAASEAFNITRCANYPNGNVNFTNIFGMNMQMLTRPASMRSVINQSSCSMSFSAPSKANGAFSTTASHL